MSYAENTKVSSEKSRAEIEQILGRYGASSFAYGWEGSQDLREGARAVVMFRARGKHVRFILDLPGEGDPSVNRTPTGRKRTGKVLRAALEQEHRRRWRALALAIKAKLEVVESGIASFEEEFAAQIMLPNGQVVGEWLIPQIEHAYETGEMPALLPGVRPELEAGDA